MSTVVMGVRCMHCSKFKPPLEIWTMPGGATICPDCNHRHDRAIEELSTLMSGGTPGCPVCSKSSAELKKLAGGGDYSMYVHWRDGVYVPHCDQCHAAYTPKRSDLYRGTQFGKDLKI
jgi:hypothetical protein